MSEKISVIVPIYRVEEYLPACLDSILRQTYGNLEILLVDDGSPDRCGEICEEYAARDARIRVIHKANGGLSSARNAGLEIASGDYIAFVDSDDFLEPDAYECMLAAAKKYDVGLVCAGRYDDDLSGASVPGLCPEREEAVSGEETARRIFRWNGMDSAAWDKLYCAALFDDVRYPEGMIAEDVPTTYRLALRAGRAALLPKRLYHYRHRENSISTSRVSEKTFQFQQHGESVYADIRRNYPALTREAEYLLVRTLLYSVQSVDLADAESRVRFSEQRRDAARKLRKKLPFIFSSPWFSRREKLTGLLLGLGLYRSLQPIFTRNRVSG